MESNTSGNVFVFSFSQEGFEAIVNLTAIDEEYVMAKMADAALPRSVNSILNMMTLRARYNEHRRMEVWLVKLDESFTEEELIELADKYPQAAADLARMGDNLYGKKNDNPVIK